MTLLLLAILGQAGQPDAVLARYSTYMAKHPEFSVKVTLDVPIQPQPTALLLLKRPDRLLFTTKFKGDYSLSETRHGLCEIERESQIYDEGPWPGRLTGLESRIFSPVATLFPSFLLAPDLRQLTPRNAPYKMEGRKQIGGEMADVLSVEIRGQMGTTRTVGYIDDAGKLVRFERHSQGPQGKVDFAWNLTDYKPMTAIPESRFITPIPHGFVPYSLPSEDGPVQVKATVHLGKWLDPKTRQTIDLGRKLKGKKTLLALLGADSLPSRKAQTSLSKLAAAGVSIVRLSDATKAGPGVVGYIDPTGKNLAALAPPATPLFILIDSGGAVTNLWLGYNPQKASSFEKEVVTAFRSPG